jgi:neurofibromin 1
VGVGIGSQFRALGSLVYLRIFCPAIVSPHSFDLVKQPVQKEVRRHLLLIAKLIQGLANEVPPHML